MISNAQKIDTFLDVDTYIIYMPLALISGLIECPDRLQAVGISKIDQEKNLEEDYALFVSTLEPKTYFNEIYTKRDISSHKEIMRKDYNDPLIEEGEYYITSKRISFLIRNNLYDHAIYILKKFWIPFELSGKKVTSFEKCFFDSVENFFSIDAEINIFSTIIEAHGRIDETTSEKVLQYIDLLAKRYKDDQSASGLSAVRAKKAIEKAIKMLFISDKDTVIKHFGITDESAIKYFSKPNIEPCSLQSISNDFIIAVCMEEFARKNDIIFQQANQNKINTFVDIYKHCAKKSEYVLDSSQEADFYYQEFKNKVTFSTAKELLDSTNDNDQTENAFIVFIAYAAESYDDGMDLIQAIINERRKFAYELFVKLVQRVLIPKRAVGYIDNLFQNNIELAKHFFDDSRGHVQLFENDIYDIVANGCETIISLIESSGKKIHLDYQKEKRFFEIMLTNKDRENIYGRARRVGLFENMTLQQSASA